MQGGVDFNLLCRGIAYGHRPLERTLLGAPTLFLSCGLLQFITQVDVSCCTHGQCGNIQELWLQHTGTNFYNGSTREKAMGITHA